VIHRCPLGANLVTAADPYSRCRPRRVPSPLGGQMPKPLAFGGDDRGTGVRITMARVGLDLGVVEEAGPRHARNSTPVVSSATMSGRPLAPKEFGRRPWRA
jgi:hypothetical protein